MQHSSSFPYTNKPYTLSAIKILIKKKTNPFCGVERNNGLGYTAEKQTGYPDALKCSPDNHAHFLKIAIPLFRLRN